jgi:hypothetical protein
LAPPPSLSLFSLYSPNAASRMIVSPATAGEVLFLRLSPTPLGCFNMELRLDRATSLSLSSTAATGSTVSSSSSPLESIFPLSSASEGGARTSRSVDRRLLLEVKTRYKILTIFSYYDQ